MLLASAISLTYSEWAAEEQAANNRDKSNQLSNKLKSLLNRYTMALNLKSTLSGKESAQLAKVSVAQIQKLSKLAKVAKVKV